jgi:hypothetical protein
MRLSGLIEASGQKEPTREHLRTRGIKKHQSLSKQRFQALIIKLFVSQNTFPQEAGRSASTLK